MATNRVVGPAEYKQIAKQNKVTPRNFDQYFMRQGKNIVYRDQATNPTTGTSDAAASVAQEAKPQHEIFGNAIMDLLKQYQGIEKYPYAKQGFNAQQEQINRIQASPDQSMVGASPEQQNAVRGAGVSAVQPTVSGAQEAGQTFASRLNTFGDILGQARGLQQQMEQSAQQAKADARTLINNAFATTGGSEFLNMNPKELASLEKTAGLPKDYIHNTVQAIKAREEKLKQEELKSRAPQTMETSGGIFQWNPSTGKWDATGLRGYHPSSGGGGGALTLTKAVDNPLLAFLSLGGKRIPKADGGFDFFSPNGTPIDVNTAASMVPGGSPTALIEGSTSKIDQGILRTQKPATANQETTALYADRLKQAEDVFQRLEGYTQKLDPVAYFAQTNSPQFFNFLKSKDFQSLDQAERNFVNAVLRRESGAVINPSEFENAKIQYFPQPGDKPEVLQQKKNNRATVIRNFIQGAGSAYVGGGEQQNQSNQDNDPLGLFK